MKLMLELSEQELTASIANGSLVAFIANAGIERDFQEDVERPKPKKVKKVEPEPDTEPEPEPETEKDEEKKPKIKESDLRPLLAQVQKIDRKALIDKMKEYGGTFSDVDEEYYPALHKWATAMIAHG